MLTPVHLDEPYSSNDACRYLNAARISKWDVSVVADFNCAVIVEVMVGSAKVVV